MTGMLDISGMAGKKFNMTMKQVFNRLGKSLGAHARVGSS